MSIPYVLAMFDWLTKLQDEKKAKNIDEETYATGKRMVLFSIVFDELLDEILMEKLI